MSTNKENALLERVRASDCTPEQIAEIFRGTTAADDEAAAEAVLEAVVRNPSLCLDHFSASIPWLRRSDRAMEAALMHELLDSGGEAEPKLVERYPDLRSRIRSASMACRRVLGTLTTLPTEKDLPSEFGPASEGEGPRYQLLRVLGRGAQGIVYEAVDRFHPAAVTGDRSSKVAIKLCTNPDRSEQESIRARAVAHPNTARVFDAGIFEGVGFITMELVRGVPLTEWVEHQPRSIRWTRAVEIGRGICDGVAAIHAAGVIHRDIKPDNIVVTPDGRPVITDFGISSWAGDLEDDGRSIGSIGFVAPEQYNDTGRCSPRADVYSIAGVVYWMLTHRPPNGVGAENARKRLLGDGRVDAEPLEQRGVPERLVRVLTRALSRDRADRPRSAGELGDELASVADNTPIGWLDSDTAAGALFIRRHPAAISAAVLIIGLLLFTVISRFGELSARQEAAREATMQAENYLEAMSGWIRADNELPSESRVSLAWLMQQAVISPELYGAEQASETRLETIEESIAALPADALLERAMARMLAAQVARSIGDHKAETNHLHQAEIILRGYEIEDDRMFSTIRERMGDGVSAWMGTDGLD